MTLRLSASSTGPENEQAVPRAVETIDGARANGGADAVPARDLQAILTAGAKASRGTKGFQPWRFLVLRDPQRLASLRRCLESSEALDRARAVIAIFTPLASWKRSAAAALANGPGDQRFVSDMTRYLRESAWLSGEAARVATYMTLAAAVLGWEAVVSEDCPSRIVRRELDLPAGMEVVGLIAIHRSEGSHAALPGWLARFAYEERVEQPWGSRLAAAS